MFKNGIICGFIFITDIIKINIIEFEKKYSRRIERFRNIVINPEIQKIFVRLSNTKEQEHITTGILDKALTRYGCKNYLIKFVNMDKYKELIPDEIPFDWHRDYIDWKTILCN